MSTFDEKAMPQRFMDAIDAYKAGSDWLEPIAMAIYRERPCSIESKSFERSDGGIELLWSGGELVAAYAVVRDDANWSVLLQWQLVSVEGKSV